MAPHGLRSPREFLFAQKLSAEADRVKFALIAESDIELRDETRFSRDNISRVESGALGAFVEPARNGARLSGGRSGYRICVASHASSARAKTSIRPEHVSYALSTWRRSMWSRLAVDTTHNSLQRFESCFWCRRRGDRAWIRPATAASSTEVPTGDSPEAIAATTTTRGL